MIRSQRMTEGAQALAADRRNIKRQKTRWQLIFSVSVLICLSAFAFRSEAGKKADVLSGGDAIRIFLRNNRIGLLLILAMVVVFAAALIKEHGLHRSDSMQKIYFAVGSAIILCYSAVAFFLSENHIYYDYKNVRAAVPSEYVLSTDAGKYYVGFKDNGEYVQLQIPKDTYSLMQHSEKKSDDTSKIYTMITDKGYKDAVLYSGGYEVSYYFYSAIFSSAKPVLQS